MFLFDKTDFIRLLNIGHALWRDTLHCMSVLVLIHAVLFGMKKNSCRKGSDSCLSRSQAVQTPVSDGRRF